MYVYPDQPIQSQIAKLKELFTNDPDQRLRFNQAKVYVDGILDLGTSALLKPYLKAPSPPSPDPLGFEYFRPGELHDYVRQLEKAGFQIHFHATGDRGTRLALDALEAAAEANGIADRRHRISHLYLVDPRDRERFAALGVVADLQLAPDALAASYSQFLKPFIGADRVAGLLPAQSLLSQGAKVVLSSDWDAGPLSPFGTIERALRRPHAPIEKLEQAIKMLTLDAASLLHLEDITGSIEVGKRADLIVLDRHLFEIPPAKISQTEVVATYLDGELIYSSGAIPQTAGQ